MWVLQIDPNSLDVLRLTPHCVRVSPSRVNFTTTLRRRPIVFIAHLSFELGQFAPEAAWFGLVFAAFPLLYLTISRRPRQTRRLQSHEVHSSAFCDRRHLIRSGARGRGKPGTRPCVEDDGGFPGRQRNCRLPERPPAWIFVGSRRSKIKPVFKLQVSWLPPAGGFSSLPQRHDILVMPPHTVPWSPGFP